MHVNFIHKNAKKETAFSMAKVINRKKITKEDISVIEKYFIYVVDDLVKYDKDSVLRSIIILKDKNIKLICYYFGFGSFYFITKYNGKTSIFIHLNDVAKVVIGITEEKAIALTKQNNDGKKSFIKDNFLMDEIREYI